MSEAFSTKEAGEHATGAAEPARHVLTAPLRPMASNTAADAASAVDRTHLFIELQEMRSGMLRETSRWNHALEEDASGQVPGEWSRPHLPTVSIFGLVKLRAALDSRNVLIDLAGVANIDDVARQTCAALLTTSYIQVHELEPIYKALTVRSSPMTPASTPCADPGGVAGGADDGAGLGLAKALPAAIQLPAAMVQDEGGAAPKSPVKSPMMSPSRDPNADQNQDWFHLLDPDVGEEACDIILAHVDFLDRPVVAFIRLKEAIDAGCERHAPVRYLLLVVGPEAQERETVLMARAFAGVMLDETFVKKVSQVVDAEGFLAAFDEHNEHVAILPHVHALHGPQSGVPGSATGTSESSEGASDEDEVVVHEVEDELRRVKGMRPRDDTERQAERRERRHSNGQGTADGGRRATETTSVLGTLRMRPNFADSLAAEVRLVEADPSIAVGGVAEVANGEKGGGTVGGLPGMTPRTRRRLFIELEQQKKGSKEWAETHHWNWAFAQEAKTNGSWRRPHLPTVSARSLMLLHEGLGSHNVLLDAKATSLLGGDPHPRSPRAGRRPREGSPWARKGRPALALATRSVAWRGPPAERRRRCGRDGAGRGWPRHPSARRRGGGLRDARGPRGLPHEARHVLRSARHPHRSRL
jgi:hypothetical protein